jgi:hypothetical protein
MNCNYITNKGHERGQILIGFKLQPQNETLHLLKVPFIFIGKMEQT